MPIASDLRLRLSGSLYSDIKQPRVISRGACVCPPPRGGPWKPLLRVSVVGLVSASLRVVFAIMYGYVLWSCLVCSLSLLVLAQKRGRSGRTFSGVPVLFLNLECYCATASVPRSPGATLQRSGAAHGPLHPAVFFSKLCFGVFGILLGFGIRVWEIYKGLVLWDSYLVS